LEINLFNTDTNSCGRGRVNIFDVLPSVSYSNNDDVNKSTELFDIEEEVIDSECNSNDDTNTNDNDNTNDDTNTKKNKKLENICIVPLRKDGVVIGRVELIVNLLNDNEQNNDNKYNNDDDDNDNDSDSDSDEEEKDDPIYEENNNNNNNNIEEDDEDIVLFDATSDSYSHLYHLPHSKLIELKSLYKIQNNTHRYSKFGQL